MKGCQTLVPLPVTLVSPARKASSLAAYEPQLEKAAN